MSGVGRLTIWAGSMLAMTGTHPMIAALALDPSKQTTPVYLLPRSTEAVASGRDWSVPVEAPAQMWSMHVGNAFEEDNGRGGTDIRLHMSGCSYQWFHFHRMFGMSVTTQFDFHATASSAIVVC